MDDRPVSTRYVPSTGAFDLCNNCSRFDFIFILSSKAMFYSNSLLFYNQ